MFALRVALLLALASCGHARRPAVVEPEAGPPPALAVPAPPHDGDEALRRILEAEARHAVMRIEVQQRVDNMTFGKVTHADATAWVDRARGLRWDQNGDRSFVMTATELWGVFHDARTFYVKASPLTVPVTAWFAPPSLDLVRDCVATLAPSRAGFAVDLVVRDPSSGLHQLTLVAGDDGLVRTATLVNTNGDETRRDVRARRALDALPPGTLELDRAALEAQGYRLVEPPR